MSSKKKLADQDEESSPLQLQQITKPELLSMIELIKFSTSSRSSWSETAWEEQGTPRGTQ